MTPTARERVIFIAVSAAMLPLVTGEAFLLKALMADGPMGGWAAAGYTALVVLLVGVNGVVWWRTIGWLCRKLAP